MNRRVAFVLVMVVVTGILVFVGSMTHRPAHGRRAATADGAAVTVSIDRWTCTKTLVYTARSDSVTTVEVWAETDAGEQLLETLVLEAGASVTHSKPVNPSALQVQLQLREPGSGRVRAESAEVGYPAGCR